MLSDDALKQVLARLDAHEAELRRYREGARRRAANLRIAGKLCPALAVLGLASWALGQGVEIKTDNGAASDVSRLKIDTGAANVSAYFLNVDVGVGTNNPLYKLQVNADATAFDSSWKPGGDLNNGIAILEQDPILNLVGEDAGTWGAAIKFSQMDISNATDHENMWAIARQTDGDGAGDGSLRFLYGATNDFTAGTARVTVQSGGNVGIGTTAPQGLLQVQLPAWTNRDTDNQHVIFSNSTDNNYGIRFGFTGAGNYGVINVLNPGVTWGDLILQDGGGNVGLGTTAPSAKLEVAGNEIRVTHTSPQIKFQDTDGGSWKYWIHNNSDRLYFLNDGGAGGGWTGSRPLTIYQDIVGVGTSSPANGQLVVSNSANGVDGLQINHSGLDTGTGDALAINDTSGSGSNGIDCELSNAANNYAGIFVKSAGDFVALAASQGNVTIGYDKTAADGDDIALYVGDGTTNAQRQMRADAYYTAPGGAGGAGERRLRWNWNGTIVANIGGAGNQWTDGVYTTGGAVDFAECVHTDDPTLEGAEVVLIDPVRPDQVVRSSRPYDPTVMGVVSVRPGILLGAGCAFPIDMTAGWDVEKDTAVAEPAISRWAALRNAYAAPYTPEEMKLRERLTARSGEVDEMRFCILTNRTVCRETGRPCIMRPVAMMGRVPVKVTAEGGPIRIGDLITTSSTPGHAMKAGEPWRGGIIGSALEAFEPSDPDAKGKILVYVHPSPAPSGLESLRAADVKAMEGLTRANENLRGRVAALEAEIGNVREVRAALDAERAEMRDLLRQARGRGPQGPGAKARDPGPVSRADWK